MRNLEKELKFIIAEVVTPSLKKLGFKKNGFNYFRADKAIAEAFNVQLNKWNSATSKSFVFNVGLIDIGIYAKFKEEGLPVFPKVSECMLQFRTSWLKGQNDTWNVLNEGTNLDLLKVQVKSDMEDHVIPFLEKYALSANWKDFLGGHPKPRMGWPIQFLLLKKFGLDKEAEEFLNNQFKEACTPKSIVNEIHRNGEIIRQETEGRVNFEYKMIEDIVKKINQENGDKFAANFQLWSSRHGGAQYFKK